MPAEYDLDGSSFDRLAQACAAEPLVAGAKGMDRVVASLRRVADFAGLVATATRDHFGAQPGRLLDEAGNTVASDFVAWAREQMEVHHQDAAAVVARFAGRPWTVTLKVPKAHYFWLQRGARPSDGIQLHARSWQEHAGDRLFAHWTYGRPHDLSDLLQTGAPDPVTTAALGPRTLELRSAVDMDRFVTLGDELHARQQTIQATRRVEVRPMDGGPAYAASLGELHPEMLRMTWPVRRWFNDWAYSSAGRAGAIAGHLWAFDLRDWDGVMGERRFPRALSMVPMWTHRAKIAPLKQSRGLNDHELYGWLQRLNERTGGVPFHWYFYMLHGNLVKDGAGHRVLQMAEDGTVMLPEHDYRVLKSWASSSYGF